MKDKSTFETPRSNACFVRGWAVILVLAVFALGFWKTREYPAAMGFRVHPIPAISTQEPRFESRFASSALHQQSHAASLVELTNGNLRAFWFAGTREGASDVEIHSAVFDPAKGMWGKAQVVATREKTTRSVMRYVSKLGNPVCGRAADGRLWLFYVTVSVGGWSGSSITAKVSEDEGKTWSKSRRLVTSPFLNVSTMVKGTPFLYSDGTMGIPVYHEMIQKFGEILRLDQSGNVVDVQRLTSGNDHALQPVMVIKSTFDALVMMRNSGPENPRHVWSVSTRDGGRHWSKPVKTAVLNPNAALSAVMLPGGRILAVVNNQVRQGISKGRDALSLMISGRDGRGWEMVYRLENRLAARGHVWDTSTYQASVRKAVRESDLRLAKSSDHTVRQYAESASSAMCGAAGCGFEFSYPYIIQMSNGDFHLAYTWNRSFIKHIWFNHAWLNQQLHKIANERTH